MNSSRRNPEKVVNEMCASKLIVHSVGNLITASTNHADLVNNNATVMNHNFIISSFRNKIIKNNSIIATGNSSLGTVLPLWSDAHARW